MADQTLVIVESPAKAKTINKYLGRDYTVLASFGHVRDLPAKDGSVRPEEDFAMDWELADRGKSRMDEIARAAKDVTRVLLATDPDREGEAISWHVQQLLRDRRGLKDVEIRRVTFNEITKSAILDAVANPRDLDRELIEAYLARRALDYLVGFTLSPVLWRKLPGSRSAGRVQSVALRLICERELEIERFRAREFWSIEAVFRTPKGDEFTARLTHLNGRKLDKFDLPDEASARAAVAAIDPLAFAVASVETKQVRRHPAPPFTTSTLQQEASRKLGMSATQTMRTAQRLYEGVDIGGETVGLITYMRTDGLTLAGEAIAQARQAIGNLYGPTYVPSSPRVYKSTAKNAQEAHEAIRPTDLRRRPEEVSRSLSREELRLYELIWKRTMACQMESAVMDQAIVDVADARQTAVFRAVGTVIRFDGFLKVYQEDRDDPVAPGEDADESQRRLPAMAKGDAVDRRKTVPEQHFTQPPPRFTEASLVKRMEELGIGRPSTYASILQVLQDREYVRLEKKRFIPEDRGRIVTAFLENFFRRYVEYDFTAKLEEQLDDISGGKLDWKQVLRDFWAAFHAAVEGTKDLKIGDVISALDEALSDHLFPPKGDGTDPRLCPSCAKGRMGLKLGRTGAFIGCSNYPDCRYTRPLGAPGEENGGEESAFPRLLGDDPETGLPVSIRKGPYGIYAQLGPKDEAEKGEKPKRASLTKSQDPMAMTLAEALALLSLPREIGRHPESGEPILAGIGRYGPYLKHGDKYKNLPPEEDVLKIGMNRAVDLLAADNAKARPSAEPLREVGAHPDGGEPIKVFAGRYGPYVRHGKVMASLPRGVEPEAVTVEKAVEWLAAKAAKGPAKGGRGRSAAKAAPKSAAKKAPAKKAAARKGKAAE
ncbi:type I DNA topoisomerase [Inquilinus sp. OTU3971]|uniref:type I DNA topoisomerase n=1 Tax=Inquilinus sp. OTU3971 TaxID=3043855 RepID=UPI00313ABF2D